MPNFIDKDKLRESLGTAEKMCNFIDSLSLTDRQKKIAKLKYLRGWAGADIAEELGICRRTVTEDMKSIRKIIGNSDIWKG